MSTTVTYKGSTLATVNNNTKTLKTAGKYMEGDVILTDVSGGTGAVSVIDTTDSHGGTIREITALDISDTTAVASDVAQGKYFYTSAGVKTAGTATGGGSAHVWQDENGYVHLDDEGTPPISVEALSVTQNGTYTATTGHAYSPVTVNVSGGGGLEYESGTVTLASQAGTMTVTFSNSHNVAPMFFMLAENSGAVPSVAVGTNPYSYVYANWADCFGNPIYATDSSVLSGAVYGKAKTLSATTFSSFNQNIETSSTEVTATGAVIDRSGARQSWLANVPYKWIAVWAPTT